MTRFKTHTASTICLAYIFRLLFVTIAFISSVNNSHASFVNQPIHSFVDIKMHHVEPSKSLTVTGYSTVEIIEEDDDDDKNRFKLNTFLLTLFLYFLPGSGIMDQPKAITAFNRCTTYISSTRYIELRVFRI